MAHFIKHQIALGLVAGVTLFAACSKSSGGKKGDSKTAPETGDTTAGTATTGSTPCTVNTNTAANTGGSGTATAGGTATTAGGTEGGATTIMALDDAATTTGTATAGTTTAGTATAGTTTDGTTATTGGTGTATDGTTAASVGTSNCDNSTGTSTGSDTATTAGSTTAGGTFDPGLGLEGCEAQGKAWVANPQGASSCGDPLVNWCCTEPEIQAELGAAAYNSLKPSFDKFTSQGLKLYHCAVANGKFSFYFFIEDATGYHSGSAFVTGATAGHGTAGGVCTKLTSTDLGLGSDTTTGGTIPAAIGPLDDTTKAGILDALKANEYGAVTWSHDAAVRDSAAGVHGKVKSFYNDTLKNAYAGFVTGGKFPVGSVAVEELYAANGTTLQGWAVLAKGVDAVGKDSWLMYKITSSNPPTFGDAETYGMGAAACSSCHGDGKDFIKGTPP